MTATVNDQSITITDESLTVSESVGIYECDFTFDASWDTWNKTAVFEGAGETIEMIIVDNKAQIPWEVLKEAGWIKIGVYGTKGGEIKPTVWSDQIYVAEGTVPGSVEVTPTPPIYAQILDLANDAKDIAEDAQDTADDVASDWASVSATATTLSAGSPATATFSDNTFAFGIPKGAKGDTGATGATGATPDFSIGTVSTLETGQSATATITGTAAAPVLNLGLPKGNKGDNGDVANIADAYSTSATYAVGDYCIYSSQLYRCTTAITTAEAWTAAHWTAVQLGDDTSDLRSALNNVNDILGDEYVWLDGYYSIGQGIWTPQTGNVTYHSTNKFSGTIPEPTDFINYDYMSGDSFFAVWLNTSYVGYLMDGVWHRPNGNVYATPPTYNTYAIVLHNVSDYLNFRLRNVALKTENDATRAVADKALNESNLLVDTVEVTNTVDAHVANANSYGYKVKKKVFFKSYTPQIETGSVMVYVMRQNADGTYSTIKSKRLYAGDTYEINETLDSENAITINFLDRSPASQDFSTTTARLDILTNAYGWNSNTSKLVEQTNVYYIPGTFVVYDPVTNSFLDYIDDGNPCNWKGTECSVFDNILCIGDSITQGAPTPPDITPDPSKATRTVNNKEMYSYPASMKKQWGITCTNWGMSGVTSKSWYDYYSVNQPTWSGHDCAVILIGNNDYHLADDMGGLTPENLPTVSAMSKAAMMSIITKLKADNADIKIFICTLLPAWDNATALSPYVVQNIRDIAEDEDNVYLIDLSKYSIVKGSPYSYTHPTAIGYNQMAREIGGAIGYTIVKEPEEFKWIQFIGTEYAMDGQP